MFKGLVTALLCATSSLCGVSLQEAAEHNNQAALRVYAELMHEEGNLLYSPYSFLSAMSMVSAGAGGQTREQIIEALQLPADLDELHAGQAALMRHINKNAASDDSWTSRGRRLLNSILDWFDLDEQEDPLVLSTANRLWVDESLQLQRPFSSVIQEHYQGGLGQVDFQGSPDSARRAINDWVETQTNDKIQELFAAGSIDSLTRLVIANALYMKGDWELPFPKGLTQTQPFFLDDGTQQDCQLMYQAADHQLLIQDDFAAVELPYTHAEGSPLEIVLRIYLPKVKGTLAALEDDLIEDGDLLTSDAWEKRKVHVYLPRFKLQDEHSLPPLLQDLGISDAFSDAANFEGIARGQGLYIGDIVQKTFMEVDEEGTEAAAATGITVVTRSAVIEPKPFIFRADHPFMVTLVDKRSGLLLFVGRVIEP